MTLPSGIRLMILRCAFPGFSHPGIAKATKYNRVWRIHGYSFQSAEWQSMKDSTDDDDGCYDFIHPDLGVAEIRLNMQPPIALVNRKLRDEELFHFYKTMTFSLTFTDVLDPATGYWGLVKMVRCLESQGHWCIQVVKVVVPMKLEYWRPDESPLISETFD